MISRWNSDRPGGRQGGLGIALLLLGLAVLTHAGVDRPAAAQSAVRLCFEAEDAARLEAPFQVVRRKLTDKVRRSNSGAGYIEIPDKANGDEHDERNLKGEAVYQVRIPRAGDYYIWLRVVWQDGCGNSCRLAVGEGPAFQVGEEANYQVWQWQTVKRAGGNTPLKQRLQFGVNTLRILNREDGIKIDQIFVTDDPAYIPVGPLPATPDALAKSTG